MLTTQQFADLFPRADDPEGWVAALEEVLPEYGMNTPERTAAFISQCGVETGGWRWFEENMNYSADRMMAVWPRRFTRDLAEWCHRNPERVANTVYSNRMGNGPADSGDGWRFRGRGPIHLTGRDNYTKFAEDTFGDPSFIIDDPDLVAHDRSVALKSAIWYWNANNLNPIADAMDIKLLTRRINGGYNGLDQRADLFDKVYALL